MPRQFRTAMLLVVMPLMALLLVLYFVFRFAGGAAFPGNTEIAKTSNLDESVGAHQAGGREEILPVDEAFNFGYTFEPWTIFWQVLPGYYLYRDKIQVMAEGQVLDLNLPEGQLVDDPTFGRVAVLEGYVELQLPGTFMEMEGAMQELEVRWQGCAVRGYCYPPQKERLTPPKWYTSPRFK